jgi:hypothetical protein
MEAFRANIDAKLEHANKIFPALNTGWEFYGASAPQIKPARPTTYF